MCRVSCDYSVSPPPVENSVGRGGVAPVASDAPSFGDHLSRAAQPTKAAEKRAGKQPESALPATELEQSSPDVELAGKESILIAVACLANCELTEATTLDPQLNQEAAEAAETDPDAEREPSAEELSLALAMSAAPPTESIVQVDTLTISVEAEALAATEGNEAVGETRHEIPKPALKTAAVASVGQPSGALKVSPEPENTQHSDSNAIVPLTAAEPSPESQPEVATQVLETAEPVAVASAVASGATEVASSKRTSPERTKRSINISQVDENAQHVEANPDVAEVSPTADSAARKFADVERPTPSPETTDHQRPPGQESHQAATLTSTVVAAPSNTDSPATVTIPSSAEDRLSQSAKPAVESSAEFSPAAPIARATASAVDAAPMMPSRDPHLETSPIAATIGRRSDGPASNGTEVDRVRFVQRVARAMQTSVDRGGEVTLRLSPPELGAMRLEVALREGMMSARIETETPAARSVLMDNLPALRERLAEQNVRIDKFEVEVRGNDTGALPDRTADQPNSSQQGQTGRGNRKRTDSPTEITGPTTANQRSSRDGQLNVVV